ncbi:MAG: hypothetical protein V4574_02120 [Pseudomonadota bacterium]
MNRFDIFALVAVVLVMVLCLGATLSAVDIYIVRAHLPWTMAAAGVAGWILASLGPITIAALFWRWAKRVRWSWVLHLLFLPCAGIACWNGQSLMLFVMGEPDFDATIGAPVMPSFLLMAIAVAGYAVALFSRLVSYSFSQTEAR